MCWKFRKIIKIDNEIIKKDHRKFEYLIVDFLNSNFPLEKWKITSATVDNNRDAEYHCILTGKTSWAEAKYTVSIESNIGSRKYDSTLVSATIDEYVIKIFFITNTSIGDNLINRVKKFFYVTKMREIAFVDKISLENWISLHKEIQQKYFEKWNEVFYTPQISLRTLRVFHRVDSYTIDSILDFENFYPLYSAKNYFIDVEFNIRGFDKTPIQLYCNDSIIHNGVLTSGIHSFSIVNIMEKIFINKLNEYNLKFWYLENNQKVFFKNILLKLSLPPRIFKPQFECYREILRGIQSNGQIIYNIYGEKFSGKSWILQNIKEDLLRTYTDKKVIYINFCGSETDLGDLCRIIFTLIFDYYNLAISGNALQNYITELNCEKFLYSSQNIKQLIKALYEENYDKIRNILIGADNGGKLLFDFPDCYAWEKIYLVDNIHLLDSICKSILNMLLKNFKPYNNITFILSGREKIGIKSCKNILLSFVQDREILSYINDITKTKVNNLYEILPQNHCLFYPYLLNEFLKDINWNQKSLLNIYKYYIDTFSNKINLYKDGYLPINEEDALQILICSVKRGVPIEYIMENFPIEHICILLRDCIIRKADYFYPNYNRLSFQNLDFCVNYQKDSIKKHLTSLVKNDNMHSLRYIAVLIKYFFDQFLLYNKMVYDEIYILHSQNRYAEMLYLCDAYIYHDEWHEKNSHELMEIKYLRAIGIMHCGTVSDSLEIFKDLRQQYESTGLEHDSLYYDICAEIIDSEYWQLERIADLPYEINIIRKTWLSESIEYALSERSFFTCMNRIMVVYLVQNKIKKARKWFRKNMITSTIPGLEKRAGYTYMDFAKGIYHINLDMALSYLQIASTIFYKCFNIEKRRYFDCQCEIEYVSLLLGQGSIRQFEKARTQLFENEYWTQYYKAALKLSTYFALNGNMQTAKEYLIQAQDSYLLRDDTRCQYIIALLEAFLFKESPPYYKLRVKNTSYNVILNHCKKTYKMPTAVLYRTGTSEKGFYLDPRVW